jgi:hypothetical protein
MARPLTVRAIGGVLRKRGVAIQNLPEGGYGVSPAMPSSTQQQEHQHMAAERSSEPHDPGEQGYGRQGIIRRQKLSTLPAARSASRRSTHARRVPSKRG